MNKSRANLVALYRSSSVYLPNGPGAGVGAEARVEGPRDGRSRSMSTIAFSGGSRNISSKLIFIGRRGSDAASPWSGHLF